MKQYQGQLLILLTYFKVIQGFNTLCSLFLAFAGSLLLGADSFLKGFITSFFTGGFFLAVFFYELRYKKSYYFYYNKGFSKVKLITATYMASLLLLIILFCLYKLIPHAA
ncbi:MAG TPA: hypothetical protein VM802_19805 [Chitinophaga sp.]|uniref:hypothetical protein n=1 Tax=Chitinophaga sp. TaxID=1869181 RepID=UPI002B9278EE|nr:hypothetical protein [Chitinophaga sp.]HVI47132.1 hypothetical protein [Chitinophaga sp.]